MRDAAADRLGAVEALDALLEGRIRAVGELRRRWPPLEGGDPLLRRALHEGEHFLVTKGELERRFVVLMRRFLHGGGTPAQLERAYDRTIAAYRSESDPASS